MTLAAIFLFVMVGLFPNLHDAMHTAAVAIIQLQQVGSIAEVAHVEFDFHVGNLLLFQQTAVDIVDANGL